MPAQYMAVFSSVLKKLPNNSSLQSSIHTSMPVLADSLTVISVDYKLTRLYCTPQRPIDSCRWYRCIRIVPVFYKQPLHITALYRQTGAKIECKRFQLEYYFLAMLQQVLVYHRSTGLLLSHFSSHASMAMDD